MKISIITATFNSEKSIFFNIDSVLKQNYKDIEHIIVDGKSSDQTLKIIEENKKKYALRGFNLIVLSEQDNGIYDAMNKGLKKCSGDIVGFLNSDDMFYDENVISNIALKFDKNECIFGNVIYVDSLKNLRVTRIFKGCQNVDFTKGIHWRNVYDMKLYVICEWVL